MEVKRVSIREAKRRIKNDPELSKMVVRSGWREIALDLDGDGIRIGFNPAFLLEGLNAINEPYLRFKVTDPTTLAQINGQQEADSDNSEDYAYIIVPVREM